MTDIKDGFTFNNLILGEKEPTIKSGFGIDFTSENTVVEKSLLTPRKMPLEYAWNKLI